MLTGNVQRVDVTADGQTSSDTGNWGTSVIVSPDGNYVAFTGSNDLVPGQPSGGPQLFVKNLLTGDLVVASSDVNGQLGNGYSGTTAYFSDDSRFVAFDSSSNNLFSNDVNNYQDVYIKDLVTGEIKLVSLDENNNQPYDHARLSGITADGSSVSFTTYASNIDPDGDDGASLFIAPTFGNQPTIFITSSGIVNVDENLPSDTVIYDANANDINGVDIVYSLSGDDASLLQIDPDDGEVRLLSSADYEAKSSYDFNVVASTSSDSVQKTS